MTLTEALKAKGHWNAEWDLPVWSGNPHGVLATYLKLAHREEWSLIKRDWWLFSCEPRMGLFYRWPNQPEPHVSHDELIAIASMSPERAEYILSFCLGRDWIYDSVSPESGNNRWWLGRFVFFPPYIRAAARSHVSLMGQLLWAAYAVKTAIKRDLTDTSTRILFWLMLPATRSYWLMGLGAKLFRHLMQKKYPGGISEVLGIYYGKEHPFAQYAPKDFS